MGNNSSGVKEAAAGASEQPAESATGASAAQAPGPSQAEPESAREEAPALAATPEPVSSASRLGAEPAAPAALDPPSADTPPAAVAPAASTHTTASGATVDDAMAPVAVSADGERQPEPAAAEPGASSEPVLHPNAAVPAAPVAEPAEEAPDAAPGASAPAGADAAAAASGLPPEEAPVVAAAAPDQEAPAAAPPASAGADAAGAGADPPEGTPAAPEGPEGDQSGADGADKSEQKGNPKEGKPRTLDQMMSLKPGDDERTELSKKISWILRHGAKKVNIEMDEEGWVRLGDLAKCELFNSSQERLLSVINESNSQKMRYELKEVDEAGGGGSKIRAISKSRRNAMLGKERRERRRDKDNDSDDQRPDRAERDRRSDRDRRSRKAQDPPPTYEEQIREGFRPVYQGNTVVAMLRGDEAVRPGRREFPEEKGSEKGGEKGEKGDPKGNGKSKDNLGDLAATGPGRPDSGVTDKDGSEGSYRRRDRDEKGYGRNRPPREDRGHLWRVVQGQEAIMRAAIAVESDKVATLLSGTLVQQMGEEKVIAKGIVRMQVETIEPQRGVIGWVTRSAQSAGGPVFFSRADGGSGPVDSGRERGRDRRGGKGRDKGKGKGEGKGKEGGKRYHDNGDYDR